MASLSGFSLIKDAKSARDGSCFLGVIVEIKSPFEVVRKDRSRVFSLEFTLQDQFSSNPTAQSPQLKCRLNRESPSRLPKGSIGDVAILKHMKMSGTNEGPLATNLGQLMSEALFFSLQGIPTPQLGTPFAQGGTSKLKYEAMLDSKPPSPSEQLAVIDMKATAAAFLPLIMKQTPFNSPLLTSYSRGLPPSNRSPYTKSAYGRKKEALIKDVVANNFYNLTGEVVKMFSTHNAMDLYITDYTENKDLFPYTDPNDPDNMVDELGYTTASHKWRGPYGQLTLKIRLWDKHVYHAQETLKEGEIAFVQNVRIKWTPEGRLEGSVYGGDPKYPNKKCVHKCVDPEQLSAVRQRKNAYERSGEQLTAHVPPQILPKKPSTKSSTKKKEERRVRNRLQKELEQQELQAELRRQDMNRAGLNNNVRSGHSQFQLSTISQIITNPARRTITEDGLALSLPFINCKYRTNLRAVDFWPMTLTKFSRSMGDITFNTKATPEQRQKLERKFEWNFVILVEDAASPARSDKERIPLVFGNTQGQNLLQMNACDLQANEAALKMLELKLFILWGNLYERKLALWKEKKIRLPLPSDDPQLQLNNLPFECCIQEYGEAIGAHAEADHWVRRFSTFNTTIFN